MQDRDKTLLQADFSTSGVFLVMKSKFIPALAIAIASSSFTTANAAGRDVVNIVGS